MTVEAQRPMPADHRRPLYPRLLRLRHIHPNAWQRALLGEGALALAVLLVLADLATAWTLLVLPLAVAVVVKAHDLLAGQLGEPASAEHHAGEELFAEHAWAADPSAEDPFAEDPSDVSSFEESLHDSSSRPE